MLRDRTDKGDAAAVLELKWEYGAHNIAVDREDDASALRGYTLTQFRETFGIDHRTEAYYEERVAETRDPLLKIRYLDALLLLSPPTGKLWAARQRMLVQLLRDLADANLGSGAEFAGVYGHHAMNRIARILPNGALPRADMAAWAEWVVRAAALSRELAVSKAELKDQQRNRWVASYLQVLKSVPADSTPSAVRDMALILLSEADAFYCSTPMNEDFEAEVADVEVLLRKHWKIPLEDGYAIKRRVNGLLRRAELHKRTGSPLLTSTFLHEAAVLMSKHPGLYPRDFQRQTLMQEKDSLAQVQTSGELVRFEQTLEFTREELLHLGANAEGTAGKVIALAGRLLDLEAARGQTARTCEQTSLLSAIARHVIARDKVVGESRGEEHNLDLDAESAFLLHARVLGYSASFTLVEARKQQGLTASNVLGAFRSIPVSASQLTLITHGISRLIEEDWISALQILALQCEPLLRTMLEAADFSTTRIVLDRDSGTSRTDDLTLLALLEETRPDGLRARDWIGADLSWHIERVLVSQTGENLRNLIAHGSLPAGHHAPQTAGMTLLVLLRLLETWRAKLADAPVQSEGRE